MRNFLEVIFLKTENIVSATWDLYSVKCFFSDPRKGYWFTPVKFCMHIGDKITLNLLLTIFYKIKIKNFTVWETVLENVRQLNFMLLKITQK